MCTHTDLGDAMNISLRKPPSQAGWWRWREAWNKLSTSSCCCCCDAAFDMKASERAEKAFCFMFFLDKLFTWLHLRGIYSRCAVGVGERWKRVSCCKISGLRAMPEIINFPYTRCHKYCVKNFLYWIKIPHFILSLLVRIGSHAKCKRLMIMMRTKTLAHTHMC